MTKLFMWTAFAEYMYQSASCLVAHKGQQLEGLHPSLSAAATLASVQDLHLCWQSRISVHFPLSLSRLFFSVLFCVFLSFFCLHVSRKGLCCNHSLLLSFLALKFPSSAFYFLAQWSVSCSIAVIFLVSLFGPAIASWDFV